MIQPSMNADERRYDDLTFRVNGCAMTVLNALGHGYHEKIYENGLAVVLKKNNIHFSQQKQFNIFLENEMVGTFIPDFVIDDKIIVEMKTIDRITDHEKGQVLNYLKATGLEIGLIYNFKFAKLEWQKVILQNRRLSASIGGEKIIESIRG